MDKIKKVGILYHPMIAPAAVLARELADYLAGCSVSVWLGSSWEQEKARSQMPGTDLILSVGGDGTILRSVQVVIGTGTPVVGVNLGRLGFMTELSSTDATKSLAAILSGEGWADERSMLEAVVRTSEPGECRTFYALNDIVVARGAVARVVNIEVTIDGEKFTDYTADGVIAATATGSTGYSLAAGGPIVYPWSKDFLLLPILPHLSLPYSLVLPETATVEIRVSTPYAATLSIDGHTNLPLASGSTVNVKTSVYKTRFLRIHPESSFFSTLQQKLKGRRNAVSGTESQNG
jgi:NAD+ kinase